MTGVVRALFSLAVWLALGMPQAFAHKGSDAYLDVQQVGATDPAQNAADPAWRDYRFTLAVAIKDLDVVVPLDANSDGKVTWGELKLATASVQSLLNVAANIELSTVPPAPPTTGCQLDWLPDGVERRSDGAYLRMVAQTRCPGAQPLAFKYTLFKAQDATHRLLVAGRIDGRDLLTTTSPQQLAPLLLSGGAAHAAACTTPCTKPVPGTEPSSRLSALRDYFLLGAHHLLEGYDHLAFLLALVLPLRLSLRPRSPVPSPVNLPTGMHTSGNVWLALLRTITAFTVGHSITLMLATFGWTQASPVWVEPVIAASIGVTAFLNLRPVHWLRTDVLALVFGLVHGFGFAGLLQEAAAPSGLLPWALAGFNLGVEAGQLIAVTGWVLLAQLFVTRAWYARVVVRGGSIGLMLLASWWFFERVR